MGRKDRRGLRGSAKVMGLKDCKSWWDQKITGDGSLERVSWKLRR